MGMDYLFVSLNGIESSSGTTPLASIRSGLSKLGVVLPELDDGEHSIVLESSEVSVSRIAEEATLKISGGGVVYLSIHRPSSPGIQQLCYELLVSGFAMFVGEHQFATSDALTRYPRLHDSQEFRNGFKTISCPEDLG